MDRILVGVDGSLASQTALRWAAGLARRRGVGIEVVHAWAYPADAVISIGRLQLPPVDTAEGAVAASLAAFVANAIGDGGEDPTLTVKRGPAAAALLSAARVGHPFVVVGSRGLGGFEGLRQGSVSRQVCEHATRPVTVVREAAPVLPFRLERILAATDGSPPAARALGFAGELAQEVGAELLVAHAATEPAAMDPHDIERVESLGSLHERVESWCAPLDDRGVPYDVTVTDGDARTALLDQADVYRADLIVVGSRGRGPLTSLLLGSVAASLAQRSRVPLTIVPPERR